MSMRIWLLSALMSFTLAACASDPGPSRAFNDNLASAYQLDSGDQLRVVVFGQEDLSNTYSVDGGGSVSFPLIGAVHARGKTVREFEQQVGAMLGARYIRNPDVSVEVAQYRPFFILGEVQNPGQYPYVAGMTIQTAAAIAGGYTSRAKTQSADISRQISGRIVTDGVSSDHAVRPGDTITVRERLF